MKCIHISSWRYMLLHSFKKFHNAYIQEDLSKYSICSIICVDVCVCVCVYGYVCICVYSFPKRILIWKHLNNNIPGTFKNKNIQFLVWSTMMVMVLKIQCVKQSIPWETCKKRFMLSSRIFVPQFHGNVYFYRWSKD